MTNGLTVSQAQGWQPGVLSELADGWDSVTRHVQMCAERLDHELAGIGSAWRGSAAEAARRELTSLVVAMQNLCRSLVIAAAEARDGAVSMAAARDRVLTTAAEARNEGCVVADDGTVDRPARPSALLVMLAGGANSPANALADVRAHNLTTMLQDALTGLGEADVDVARAIDAAFEPATARSVATHPADISAAVEEWPRMSQDRIAAQIAAMPLDVRAGLIRQAPLQVGNTDGIPWEMRIAANRLNIANAILDERRALDRPVDDKLAAAIPPTLDLGEAERLWAVLHVDPNLRSAAIAAHDRDINQRIALYQGLLADVPDPINPGHRIARQILAFDPARTSLIELSGDLAHASAVGVLIPGLNTSWGTSAENITTARRFVTGSNGSVAMITYLGGRFPRGEFVAGLIDAADPRYATEMAPRLVAFSEDVDRTVAGLGRSVSVTYIGHSYGGSILGTAERFGLTADQVIYAEAAGAGVGVNSPADWHNRNPDVRRFAITAPGDWISLVQGIPFGPHGADPDEMPGVVPLAAGRRLNGWPMIGPSTHSDVLNEPSDAWRNILAVITGDRENVRVG